MKEIPILFSGDMVRALLDGRKTQTRRIVKVRGCAGKKVPLVTKWNTGADSGVVAIDRMELELYRPKLFAEVGDRLWVKETFFPVYKWKHAPMLAAAKPDFLFRADYDYREANRTILGCHHWTPSIFMPRRASRITLEVVSARFEPLTEINAIDAWAEGCPFHPKAEPEREDIIGWYRGLWEKLNGPGSWLWSPWVSRVEFKRID